jgi:hypothetical protein
LGRADKRGEVDSRRLASRIGALGYDAGPDASQIITSGPQSTATTRVSIDANRNVVVARRFAMADFGDRVKAIRCIPEMAIFVCRRAQLANPRYARSAPSARLLRLATRRAGEIRTGDDGASTRRGLPTVAHGLDIRLGCVVQLCVSWWLRTARTRKCGRGHVQVKEDLVA